jgi:Uma2 family endonuclease
MTADEFDAFVLRPENADRGFERVDGEVIEASPGRTRYSEIADLIVFAVRLFCREHNLPCHTSGRDGAYRILDSTLAPDFAYKPTPMSDEYPDPVPPLWAVEIISPTDKGIEIRAKRKVYRDAGILLWEVYPPSQSVDVYVPGHAVFEAGINDILNAGDVLPGFTLPVKDLFPA